MTLGDKQMGDMYMLLPAASFGLVWEEAAAAPEEAAGSWPEKQPAAQTGAPQAAPAKPSRRKRVPSPESQLQTETSLTQEVEEIP